MIIEFHSVLSGSSHENVQSVLSNTVSVLNHKIELIKLTIFTLSLVRIFHFLKIYFRNKINWIHKILDYRCNVPFVVRICLCNYIDLSDITSDL